MGTGILNICFQCRQAQAEGDCRIKGFFFVQKSQMKPQRIFLPEHVGYLAKQKKSFALFMITPDIHFWPKPQFLSTSAISCAVKEEKVSTMLGQQYTSTCIFQRGINTRF